MKSQTDIIIVLCFWVIYSLLIAWFSACQSHLLLLTLLIVGLVLTAIYLSVRILSSLKGKKTEIPKEEVEEEPEDKPKEEQDWNPAIIENFENVFKPDFGAVDLD